jgi:hypothetical protein
MSATFGACAELPSGTAVRFALKWQLFGLLLMACHVILTKQSLFLAPLMMILLAWLYANAPLAGLIVYLQILIYQNWIIGLLADGMDRETTFVVLQGTNFLALVMMAMIGWTRLVVPKWRHLRPILWVVAVALGLAAVYWAIGAAREGITSASIYFRATTAMVFAVIVGLDLGRIYSYRTVAIAFLVSMALSLALDVVELAAPEAYYDATNAVAFMILKTAPDSAHDAFYTAKDIMTHNEVIFFNLTGSDDSNMIQHRFVGTIMHPISNAYIIAASALVAWSVGYGAMLLVIVPLLALASVKGAALLVVCSMALWLVWTTARNKWFLGICGATLFAVYVGVGVTFGQANGDFHVIGFIGGFDSLFSAPQGHGIGVGGNLSENAAAGFKWQRFQEGGASFALESAVGVLFYQMGIASAAILAVFLILLKMANFNLPPYGRRIINRHGLMFIALASVAANGVFQEEAYAPTAAGLFTMMCAIIIANGNRVPTTLNPSPPLAPRVKIAHV